MKKLLSAIAVSSVVLLSGCASQKTDYFTINCSNKTVNAPSGKYSQSDLALIKRKVNYICLGKVGLVTFTKKDLAEFK